MENDLTSRIKVMLMAMGMWPLRRGFNPLVEAIAESVMRKATMKAIYNKIAVRRNKSPRSLERSIRLCLRDIDSDCFAKEFNELTGFIYVGDCMKFSSGSFIGLMSEIVSIAFSVSFDNIPDSEEQPSSGSKENKENKV